MLDEAWCKQCVVFPYLVNFILVNNPHLVKEVFNLPEFVPQFNVIVVEITLKMYVFSLLEIVTEQP
jgi:hypothetical protein